MIPNRMRISLSQKSGEIRGQIAFEGDGTFALEGLALAIHQLADRHGLTTQELMNDLYVVVLNKVTL